MLKVSTCQFQHRLTDILFNVSSIVDFERLKMLNKYFCNNNDFMQEI